VISSLHSYLILAYAGSEKAAEDVGFYYAANAGGRLTGILLSCALYHTGGLPACLWGSTAMLVICLAVTTVLPATAAPTHVRRQPGLPIFYGRSGWLAQLKPLSITDECDRLAAELMRFRKHACLMSHPRRH